MLRTALDVIPSLAPGIMATALSLAAAASGNPVTHEEIRFAAGDTTLAATLYRGTGPDVASLVIAPGSGPLGRDFPIYTRLAESLARGGVAVLVYDKRGVGSSGGRYAEVPDLGLAADDLSAALQCLRARMGAAGARTGVLGISQGGWIAPVVASRTPVPAFYIGISTPGVSTLEQNLHERTRALMEGGYDSQEVAEITAVRRQLWAYYRTGRSREPLKQQWKTARSQPWFRRVAWPDTVPEIKDLSESQVRSFRGVGYSDPTEALEALRSPVLLLFGAKDRHIDVARALEAHRAAFARPGPPDTTFVVFPGLGHLLQSVTGPEECATCEHSSGDMPIMDPAVADTILTWLRGRLHVH